jgi:hypothetical protein
MHDSSCRFCLEGSCQRVLDLGLQPLTNRYLKSVDEQEFKFQFELTQCMACGVVQIADVPSADQLRSRFPWIVYNEPEAHLDDVAMRITRLPGVGSGTVVAGTTYKDDSTLARLDRLGLKKTWHIDLADDLGVDVAGAGLETLQERLTPQAASNIGRVHGRADIVIVRHVFEHAHRPAAFLEAVRQLVKPRGYVVFEVPDCTRGLEMCDYSMPWEEHVAYFTPATLSRTLESNGFQLVALLEYPYSHENSIVAICEMTSESPVRHAQNDDVRTEVVRADRYSREFPRRQAAYRHALGHEKGRIALFGAGHLSATFVNVLGLSDLFDCVIDDNPCKQGLFMPGSRLPIVSSAALGERQISRCLLTVRPEIEESVRERHRTFTLEGGEMLSIFPSHPHPILLEATT